MPLAEALRDTFSDGVVDTVKWPNNYNTGAGGLPTEPGGRARVPCDTGFAAYASDNAYTLEASHVSVAVYPPADGGAASEAWAQLLITSSTAGTDAIAEVNAATGLLTFAKRTGYSDPAAVTLAYNPTDHRYLRIREEGGNLRWETSPDGITWTIRRSSASPSWVGTATQEIQLIAHRDGGTPDFAEFDDLNVIPSTAVFTDLTDDFDAPTVDTVKWPNNYNPGGPLPDQVDGRARVPCGEGFAAYASDTIYRLQGSHARVKVTPPPGAGHSEAYAQLVILSSTIGTQIIFEADTATGNLLMTTQVGFVAESPATLPYDSAAHAWLRLREDAGTLFWDTSTDGRAWTNRRAETAPTWVAENDLQVQLLAHCNPVVTGADISYAYFDDFNITPTLPEGYTVAVDWGADGSFDDTHDNVTADVLARGPVVFSYGRDQARQLAPPRVGTLGMTLCNAQRIYSPENPDSPIADDMSPAAPVKVETVYQGVLYPLFTGRIDDLQVHPDRGDRSIDITALDLLSLLQGVKISTEVHASQRTGTLIGIILDAIGWTGPRDLDLGGTFVPWWWLEEADAFAAVTDLLQSEGPPSIAYVAPDGTFVFRDRHHRLLRPASLTPQAAFGAEAVDVCATPTPDPAELSFLDPFGYSHGWRDIVNTVNFDIDERHPQSAITTVWESNDTTVLTLGQSIQIQAKASDPFRDAQDLTIGTDIVFAGAGTVATSLSRRSGQSTTITITAIGATVTITHLQVRARPVPTARTVKVSATDSVSIERHGLRSNPADAPWAGQHDAQAIAYLLLAHYAQRRPTVELRLVSSDGDHLLQILTRTISDLITIRHGELGLDADFHIESLTHTITRMPDAEESETGCETRVHYATLGCERSGLVVATNPFTFDVAGLGFDDGVFDPTAADDPDAVFIFDHPTQGRFDTGRFGT
jgi:hypothetical protein